MSRPSTLQLGLADVARLAQVRRPVVSMWRRRELAGHPFPEPVVVVAGEERFDAFEVADYLEATGRGRNEQVRDDLAAHATSTGLSHLDGGAALDALTALLCLVSASDEPLADLDAAATLRRALDIDPADSMLSREVAATGDDLPALAAHAGALADASYSPKRAFELLLRQQLSRSLPGHAAVALRDEAVRLAARVAVALASEAGFETPVFVDVTDGRADLLLAIAESYAAEPAPSLASVPFDTRSARLARRRLFVHDRHRLDVAVDESGDLSFAALEADAVHVMQLPPAGDPSLSDVEVLKTISNLVRQLAGHSRLVVLGPASALVDRPEGVEVDLARDRILRTGRLRYALRLPSGLVVHSPRQALALWALGPPNATVPVTDRFTVVSDHSDAGLTEAVVGSIVTDAVTAMASRNVARRHAFHSARRVRTALLLPGRTSLVDQATRRPAPAAPPDLAVTIDSLVRELDSSHVSGLRVEAAAPDGEVPAPSVRTLGQAIDATLCRIVPGNRVADADVTGGSGRTVIGPAELLAEAPMGDRRIDLLTFAGSYPSARFTEPGDVVFCTAPRPVAWVDRAGGSVVLAPARVLRIDDRAGPRPALLLPDVLAADIRAAADRPCPGGPAGPRARDWRRWPVRLVPARQREALAWALAAIEHERRSLMTRREQLEALERAVTDGVTSQSLTIDRPKEGH
ncbi:MAG: hypothetical protein L0H25_06095 [Micrococcales bacterium]|nr:hypothetical protein [Micrococcales bacterium]